MKRLEEVLSHREGNYMLPFFWQHGEDEKTLRSYMEIIQKANINEVCVESRPHPDFVGEKWWKDMDVILEEAEKRGMRVWILDDSHFPTGFANGAIEHAPKHLHHWYLCKRILEMAGPIEQVEFVLKDYTKRAPLPPWFPQPEVKEDYRDNRLLSITAYPVNPGETLGEGLDLTDCVGEDGVVRFSLPKGYYRIYVAYLTRDGKGRNNYINFMDKASCRLLLDAVYEPHYAHYKKYFGNTIAGFFSDEPPVGNVEGYLPIGNIGTADQDLPWSDAAEVAMTKEYGSEEWKKNVGYLWAEVCDSSLQAKVRTAYMDMVTRLIEECFSKQNAQWCEEHGVEYIGHMLEDCDMNMRLGASMGHFFRGLSGQHMAGIDNIGGQVMIGGQDVTRHDHPACDDEAGFYQYTIGKLGASHAAIDPKKKGRCMCENFGAYGWQSGPKEQKHLMDHFLVRGVNRYVPHAFSPAPFPDPDCPPHFYAHGENPTYLGFAELMAYSNRVCHLIDGGKACPDVAVLYAAESVWAGNADSNIPVCRALSRAQIDFHLIPADVFAPKSEYPFAFDGKQILINGVSYRALVISGAEYVDPDVAAFVKKAKETGFPVFFVDHQPKELQGVCRTVSLQELADTVKEVLKEELQVGFTPASKLLTTYHYRQEHKDIYLLLNEDAGSTYQGKVMLRAEGKPVRYFPWTNRLETVAYRIIDNAHVEVDLMLDPLELGILVFGEENEFETTQPLRFAEEPVWKAEKALVKQVESKAYLDWALKKRNGAYEGEVLQREEGDAPFTGMQKAYPDFSGFYLYEMQVSLDAGLYLLEADQIGECGELFVDGRRVGTMVQAPYRYVFEIAEEGMHTLRMDVATLTERKARKLGVDVTGMPLARPFSATGLVGNVRIYKAEGE